MKSVRLPGRILEKDENALKYCLNKLETKSERLPDSAKRDAIGDIIYVNGDT
jgi:hypothetical protein